MNNDTKIDALQFDRQSDEFMCCNGKIHSKIGSVIIALCAVGLCVGVLCMVSLEEFISLKHLAIFIYLILFAIVIALLLFALKTERRIFLLPYIAFSLANVFLCIMTAFMAVWCLTSQRSTPSEYLNAHIDEQPFGITLKASIHDKNVEHVQQKATFLFATCSLLVSLLAIPIFLYSSRVVYRCYSYFKALHKATKASEAAAVQSQTVQTV